MKWIGLTGGIATGKSTAAKLIQSRGCPVVDADAISHRVTQVGEPGYNAILSHFGTPVLNPDQSLNRRVLAQIIFQNVQKKTLLENILHPLIQKEVREKRDEHARAGQRICFYDIPLLFEKNLQSQFDRSVLVWCPPDMQRERLMKRNGLTPAEAEQRLNNQMSLIEKVRLSDHCLDNSTNERDLDLQIERLLEKTF